MHPPISPTPWDSKLEYYSRKVFIWFAIPAFAILFLHWWLERCDCKEYCEKQGGVFVELDTGSRFEQVWRCVCEVNGNRQESIDW